LDGQPPPIAIPLLVVQTGQRAGSARRAQSAIQFSLLSCHAQLAASAMNILLDTAHLDACRCPLDKSELEVVLRSAPEVDPRRSLDWLSRAVHATSGFFETLLPFVWQQAREAHGTLPAIAFLDAPGQQVLTQRQCLAILASAFFCSFAERPSDDCLSLDDLPSINFDELYGGRGPGDVEVAKLHMLFGYFERCRQRASAGDVLGRPIRFRRQQRSLTVSDWRGSVDRLVLPRVMPIGRSLDEAKGMLRVDFANAIIGGAVLAYGCLQEEIMFSLCPELIVARLFCPILRDGEAIVILGAEQFSSASGYAEGLTYAGPYQDMTPIGADGSLASYVVAIDALDFNAEDPGFEYTPQAILRELNKAFAGFDGPDSPAEVATGNWGCGAFGGDPELKSVLQWLAATRAHKAMCYFPWANASLAAELPALTGALVASGATVGDLATFLLSELEKGGVYGQLRTRFLAA
jgi:poly(ADP-ribose) glycohydrolase